MKNFYMVDDKNLNVIYNFEQKDMLKIIDKSDGMIWQLL